MSFYPVVWKVPGGTLVVAGRLELGLTGLILRGGARNGEHEIELGYDEIVGVSRTDKRIGRLSALQIDGRFGSLLVAAFGSVGLNHEIVEQLGAALARLA